MLYPRQTMFLVLNAHAPPNVPGVGGEAQMPRKKFLESVCSLG